MLTLVLVLPSIAGACSPARDALPTCRLWNTLKDQLDQGIPKVGIYALTDDMSQAADASGYSELQRLVDRLSTAFILQPQDQPPTPDVLAAGRALERFCVAHASPSPT